MLRTHKITYASMHLETQKVHLTRLSNSDACIQTKLMTLAVEFTTISGESDLFHAEMWHLHGKNEIGHFELFLQLSSYYSAT